MGVAQAGSSPAKRHSVLRSARWLLVALLFAGGMYGAWMLTHPEPGGQTWRNSQTDAVREAIFRSQIAEHRHNGEICFLTVSNNAAENVAFARRFAGTGFVRPLTDSDEPGPRPPMLLASKTNPGFTDATTGKPALHFWVEELEWISDKEAEVRGGGANAGTGGDFGVFTVAWRNGRWSVTSYKPRGML